jgi:hypothetical protein
LKRPVELISGSTVLGLAIEHRRNLALTTVVLYPPVFLRVFFFQLVVKNKARFVCQSLKPETQKNCNKYGPSNGRCYYIHYSSDQITKNEMSGACSTHGKRRGAYRIFEGKSEKQRQLGRHRRRCENNIKMEFQKVEIGGVDLIYLHQNRDRCRVLVMQ